jgi:hypothetical protein
MKHKERETKRKTALKRKDGCRKRKKDRYREIEREKERKREISLNVPSNLRQTKPICGVAISL